MYSLENRIIFITGASAGIGAACAEAFADLGARLLLCARREERLFPFAGRLREKYGVDVETFSLDVVDATAVDAALDSLQPEWTEIDVLINNAGKALGMDKSYESRLDHIDGMIDTNVKGMLHVMRAVVPGMVERNRGHVIQIGSAAGHWVYPGGTVYCASKFAVHALNEGLKMDLHGSRVRVSSVDPGLVETEFSLVRFEGDETRAESVYAGIKPLTGADVADAVVYCATRPPHVNINEILLMCTDQSSATMVNRRPTMDADLHRE
jgi:3-hydroxy acid dehydrogenase / malonic semialdehyde reductase